MYPSKAMTGSTITSSRMAWSCYGHWADKGKYHLICWNMGFFHIHTHDCYNKFVRYMDIYKNSWSEFYTLQRCFKCSCASKTYPREQSVSITVGPPYRAERCRRPTRIGSSNFSVCCLTAAIQVLSRREENFSTMVSSQVADTSLRRSSNEGAIPGLASAEARGVYGRRWVQRLHFLLYKIGVQPFL